MNNSLDQQSNLVRATEDLRERGYVPLRLLAAKHGYTKYHLGRLARTGRLAAIRCGTKGDWFVSEDSFNRYHQELIQNRFVSVTARVADTERFDSVISSERATPAP